MQQDKPAKRPLNERQQRFVDYYLVSLNASQAALQAGYSPRTAFRAGAINMQKYAIQQAIQEASQKLAKRTGIQQEDVIRENQHLAFTNIRDYLSYDGDGVKLKPSSDLTDDQARAVASVREHVTADGKRIVELKLHDKQKALAEIAARLWPVPRTEVPSGPVTNITYIEVVRDSKPDVGVIEVGRSNGKEVT